MNLYAFLGLFMNLLAHLYLANQSQTSMAGQLLGDMVKGRLNGQYSKPLERGIYLHRRIDSFTDHHAINLELKHIFPQHLRRYAGIFIDIGYDYQLARRWDEFSALPLNQFCNQAIACAQAQWPNIGPFASHQISGLERVIANYNQPHGIQRCLNSVARRLQRTNHIDDHLALILHHEADFKSAFDVFFPQLISFVDRECKRIYHRGS